MAYHIFIVSSMLIVGFATSTPTPPPSTPITLETCGITKACGPNDSYTILCPASRTCNEYYKCDKGVVSIHTCDKAFYLFWLAPVYDPAAKTGCKYVYSLCTPVRPGENGLCPTAAAQDLTVIAKDLNAPVKRHAGPAAEPGVPAVVANAEPTKDTTKEDAKPEEPTAEKKPEGEQKMEEAEQESKPEIKDGKPEIKVDEPEIKDSTSNNKDGKPEIKAGKRVHSSASVATASLSVIVTAILFNVFIKALSVKLF